MAALIPDCQAFSRLGVSERLQETSRIRFSRRQTCRFAIRPIFMRDPLRVLPDI